MKRDEERAAEIPVSQSANQATSQLVNLSIIHSMQIYLLIPYLAWIWSRSH